MSTGAGIETARFVAKDGTVASSGGYDSKGVEGKTFLPFVEVVADGICLM